MGKIIGIDLGTTNSVVAIMEGNDTIVVTNPDGNRTTPSVVAFDRDGQRLVGQIAKNQAVTNPQHTVYSIKRFMGRRHNEVEAEEKLVPYKIVGGASELVKVEVQGKKYTPPEISAMILQYLKSYAESYLGEKVDEAVITVPAYFNDSQRQATKDAGTIAGLKVRRIINEPTAAALAYGLDKKKDEKIVVYDLGGGTFDVSVLEVGDNVVEVKATNGDTHLGGDDFDQVLVHHLADEFQKQQGIDLRKDPMALQRLKTEAEKAKCALSGSTNTRVNLPYVTADASGPKHLDLELSRAKFESLVAHLVERTRKPCEQALKDAKLKTSEIDEVVLVGGSTRMPCIQDLVRKLFDKEPNRSVNPDEVVAVGAAIQGGVLAGDVTNVLLLDVTPLTLGIETEGGIMTKMIERNTTIPTDKEQIFSTAADSQTAVDVYVFQGERPMARENRLLGHFQLTGILPAPRGLPQIKVKFDIDANGILKVNAKDMATGKEQAIEIKSSSGLNEADIERMVKDAESHASEDSKRKELAEAKNEAEHFAYGMEKVLRESEDKLQGDDRDELQKAIERLREVAKKDDAAEIRSVLKSVESVSHKVAEKLYKAAAAAGQESKEEQPAGAKASRSDDDEIIDADYEVK